MFTTHDLEDHLGGELAEHLDATRYVKPEGLKGLAEARLLRFRRARSWAVIADTKSVVEALKIGARVRRNLVGKRSLTAADHFFHDLDLFVIYDGGFTSAITPKPTTKGRY